MTAVPLTDSHEHTDVVVEARDISRRFGNTQAVAEVSFRLRRGNFLTLLGASGSGKTTLLRIIAGFIQPDRGEIYLHGQPLLAVPAYQRSIGMVFQRLALFPHMTAAANVAYPLKMRGFPVAEIPERVNHYLELVRLHGLGERRIQALSGGQQQRVAIARALVYQPDLLLLDEPLAALDRKLREDMQLEFRRIQQDLGVTTINVTHDQREALVMSDEIMVMDQGHVQQLAAPMTTYHQPANRFVAGFVGVTNFLAAEILAVTAGMAEVQVGGQRLRGRCQESVTGAADGALRAEQIRLADDPTRLAELDVCLSAVVIDTIFEGDRLVYELRCPALADSLLRVFHHDPAAPAVHRPGDTLSVGWNHRDLLVFPH